MQDIPLEKGGASPLRAYSLLSFVFCAGLIALALSGPARFRFVHPLSWTDFALLAATAHKLSRLITHERVTMSLRAPFTLMRDEGRGGVHEEEPKGHGLQRALGELLTCPYCLAPWIATVLVAGYVFIPLPTRVVTTVFSLVTVSDFLHHIYTMLEAKRRELEQQRRVLVTEQEHIERAAEMH